MLILKRFRDEEICIGDDITIKVVHVQGGFCNLGITAPDGVPIHRAEVRERIKAEEAAKGTES